MQNANYGIQIGGQMKYESDLFDEFQPRIDNAFERKVTGYRIYNAEQKRLTKENLLPDLYPDLPDRKYDIIYADPPWDYGGKMQFDKTSSSSDVIDLSKVFL